MWEGHGSGVLSRKDWRPERVAAFAVPLIILAVMGMGARLFERAGAPPPPALSFREVMGGTLGFQAALLAGLAWFLHTHDRKWADAFGWRRGPVLPAVMQGVGLALIVLPVAYSLQWLSIVVLKKTGLPAAPQAAVEHLLANGSVWQRAGLAVFAVGVAPAVEEMLFRGVFFTCLRDLGHPRAALWVTAVFFGLVHTNLPAFLPLTVFGAALAWLYNRTGNLLACIAAHALFNLVPFVVLALGWHFGDAGGTP